MLVIDCRYLDFQMVKLFSTFYSIIINHMGVSLGQPESVICLV